MAARTKLIIINLIGFVAALCIYAATSQQTLNLQLFGLNMTVSAAISLFVGYIAGVLIGAGSIIPFIQKGNSENVEKLKTWQEQDAKLALEVQSDREKQLEAKIATLESALKQALKK